MSTPASVAGSVAAAPAPSIRGARNLSPQPTVAHAPALSSGTGSPPPGAAVNRLHDASPQVAAEATITYLRIIAAVATVPAELLDCRLLCLMAIRFLAQSAYPGQVELMQAVGRIEADKLVRYFVRIHDPSGYDDAAYCLDPIGARSSTDPEPGSSWDLFRPACWRWIEEDCVVFSILGSDESDPGPFEAHQTPVQTHPTTVRRCLADLQVVSRLARPGNGGTPAATGFKMGRSPAMLSCGTMARIMEPRASNQLANRSLEQVAAFASTCAARYILASATLNAMRARLSGEGCATDSKVKRTILMNRLRALNDASPTPPLTSRLYSEATCRLASQAMESGVGDAQELCATVALLLEHHGHRLPVNLVYAHGKIGPEEIRHTFLWLDGASGRTGEAYIVDPLFATLSPGDRRDAATSTDCEAYGRASRRDIFQHLICSRENHGPRFVPVAHFSFGLRPGEIFHKNAVGFKKEAPSGSVPDMLRFLNRRRGRLPARSLLAAATPASDSDSPLAQASVSGKANRHTQLNGARPAVAAQLGAELVAQYIDHCGDLLEIMGQPADLLHLRIDKMTSSVVRKIIAAKSCDISLAEIAGAPVLTALARRIAAERIGNGFELCLLMAEVLSSLGYSNEIRIIEIVSTLISEKSSHYMLLFRKADDYQGSNNAGESTHTLDPVVALLQKRYPNRADFKDLRAWGDLLDTDNITHIATHTLLPDGSLGPLQLKAENDLKTNDRRYRLDHNMSETTPIENEPGTIAEICNIVRYYHDSQGEPATSWHAPYSLQDRFGAKSAH